MAVDLMRQVHEGQTRSLTTLPRLVRLHSFQSVKRNGSRYRRPCEHPSRAPLHAEDATTSCLSEMLQRRDVKQFQTPEGRSTLEVNAVAHDQSVLHTIPKGPSCVTLQPGSSLCFVAAVRHLAYAGTSLFLKPGCRLLGHC